MLTWEELKEAKLGRTFELKELKHCCKAIYGGVAFPGKRPGFVVAVAMDRSRRLDSHDVCLLDEFESNSLRELVRHCGVLNLKHRPRRWIGDAKNVVAWEFIREMREEAEHKRKFSLCWTPMLDMQQGLYQLMLGKLEELVGPKHKQLFLKNGKVAS